MRGLVAACFPVLVLIGAWSRAAAAPYPVGGDSIAIIRTGDFHGNAVESRDGERWFGAFDSAGVTTLREVTILVTTIHDDVTDRAGADTGKRIKIEGGGEPIFLVRSEGMSAGPVTTRIAKPRQIEPGKPMRLAALRGRADYRLVGRWLPMRKGYENRGYRLAIETTDARKKRSQRLLDLGTIDESIPPVIWAGDLDRDGRLDLVLEIGNHYGVEDWGLYLSSRATGGDLMTLVAHRRHGGC